MAVKLKLGTPSTGKRPGLGFRLLRGLLILFLACLLVGAGIFGVQYFKYQKIVDDRLAAGPSRPWRSHRGGGAELLAMPVAVVIKRGWRRRRLRA